MGAVVSGDPVHLSGRHGEGPAGSMKRHVDGMTVTAERNRREKHPAMFESIRLHVRVVSGDISEATWPRW